MRFAIFTSVGFLGSLVSSTGLEGYVEKCTYGNADTCCSNSRLFRRVEARTTTCTPEKVCCQTKTIPKFYTETELNCGQTVKKSYVEVTAKPCPPEVAAGQYCLEILFKPFGDGTQYTAYHLQLSKDPIQSSTPGRFTFSNACQFGTDNLSINCYVPMSRIATDVYGSTSWNPCDKAPLYIAAHAVYGTETCWAGTIDIQDKSNNWAKYFSGTWDCDIICERSCECPCPEPTPTPTPPPGHKYCEKGTGYGYNPGTGYHLNTLTQCQNARWGWWFQIPKTDGTYTYDLLEGAGQNDPTKGTKVGTVTVAVTAGKVTVTYNMDEGYAINAAHIDLRCSKAELKCAPGQYSHTSPCLGNDPEYGPVTLDHTCTGDLYLIFHAEVTRKTTSSDTCEEVKC